MKKTLLAAAAGIAALAPLAVAGTAHADAGSPQCITKAEWFKIHKGMSRTRVAQITGTYGHKTNDTYYSDPAQHLIDVDFHQCNRYGRPAKGSWNVVYMSFANGHWTYNYDWNRGPMELDYKGSWSSPVSF